MRIVWDEPKRQANIYKHGLDFADLTIVPARGNRLQAVGRLADGTISVVFVALGTEGFSVISMRPASQKERRLLQ